MEMHDGKRRAFLRSAQVARTEQYWNPETTALKPYAQPSTPNHTRQLQFVPVNDTLGESLQEISISPSVEA
jgi:hypothetical protein